MTGKDSVGDKALGVKHLNGQILNFFGLVFFASVIHINL